MRVMALAGDLFHVMDSIIRRERKLNPLMEYSIHV